MAGAVRQPIDINSLSKYIEENIPEIELPIYVKQVKPSILLMTFMKPTGNR